MREYQTKSWFVCTKCKSAVRMFVQKSHEVIEHNYRSHKLRLRVYEGTWRCPDCDHVTEFKVSVYEPEREE